MRRRAPSTGYLRRHSPMPGSAGNGETNCFTNGAAGRCTSRASGTCFGIFQTPSRELAQIGQALSSQLSWSHYCLLMRLDLPAEAKLARELDGSVRDIREAGGVYRVRRGSDGVHADRWRRSMDISRN
jgi:hypothetical protein